MIELITVMILIGVLAAYAVARLDVAIFRERGFHDALKAGLQFGRKAAVAKRRQVCVTVATGTGAVVSFTVVAAVPEAGAAACPTANNLPLPGSSVNSIGTPAGVNLIAGNSFFFDALGRASAGVTFSSTGQPDIVVEQETGYVR
jgi:MSHA pilin protein MshC